MELFTADRHLTDSALRALLGGGLDDLQTLEAAGHVAGCAHCAGRLADAAGEPEAARQAPRGMAEQIGARIRQDERRRRREFLRFCAGAVAGMAAAIALIFAAPLPHSAVPVAEPVPQSLPAPQERTLPEPAKVTLPEPESAKNNPGQQDEAQRSVLDSLDQYFRSLFGRAA